MVEGPRLEILNGYTEMGQGVYTATMQAVAEETGLPAGVMTVKWDKELGEKCGETWASRGTTLSCAAAQRAARQLAADLEEVGRLKPAPTHEDDLGRLKPAPSTRPSMRCRSSSGASTTTSASTTSRPGRGRPRR